ncbi:unnamed protein product, partial [Thlaspi arvense]
APVELEFCYDVLQKFCTNSGSLRHSFDVYPQPAIPETQSLQLMQLDPVPVSMDSPSVILPPSTDQSPGQALTVSSTNLASTNHTIPDLPVLKMDKIDQGLYQDKPYLVLGDFNNIGGTLRSESSFSLFRSLFSVCGLQALKTMRGKYTWTGTRHSYSIKSKIDRAVANCHWLDMFPAAYVQLLPWISSDHRPLLIHSEVQLKLSPSVEWCYAVGRAQPFRTLRRRSGS